MKIHYSLKELESMPTISQSQFDDLKAESEDTRVWLSRMTIEDGQPYNNQVSIERLEPVSWKNRERGSSMYKWIITEQYEAL